MLTRRSTLIGSCSSLICACLNTAGWAEVGEEFICTTIEPDPGPDLTISDFVSNGASAARAARDDNPFEITPFGTMFRSSRWHVGDGLNAGRSPITLGVELRSDDDGLKSRVRQGAADWLKDEFAQVFALRFDVPRDKCQIRVAFDRDGGNNSEVGRANLKVPHEYSTMNIAQATARGIRHEFGHAFGLLHEHAHPKSGIVWNKPVVEAELHKTVKWSKAVVARNIFNRYAASSACVGDPDFNAGSIMLYEIPARWTLNGFSSAFNAGISERDRKCLNGTYRGV